MENYINANVNVKLEKTIVCPALLEFPSRPRRRPLSCATTAARCEHAVQDPYTWINVHAQSRARLAVRKADMRNNRLLTNWPIAASISTVFDKKEPNLVFFMNSRQSFQIASLTYIIIRLRVRIAALKNSKKKRRKK